MTETTTKLDVEAIEKDIEFQAFKGRLLTAMIKAYISSLYAVAKELHDRPLLRELIEDSACALDGADVGLPWAWDEIQRGIKDEDQLIEEYGSGGQGRGAPNEGMVAEIVLRRGQINRELEETDDKENAGELIQEIEGRIVEMNHDVFLAIAAGKVSPVIAAKAALGRAAL